MVVFKFETKGTSCEVIAACCKGVTTFFYEKQE